MSRLKVAQKAHALTLRIYAETNRFPPEERYGLTSQLRRASVSIGSKIAEGDGSDSNRVFASHVSIALGSASEVGYQLLLARDLSWLTFEAYEALEADLEEVQAMLLGLVAHLRKRPNPKRNSKDL